MIVASPRNESGDLGPNVRNSAAIRYCHTELDDCDVRLTRTASERS